MIPKWRVSDCHNKLEFFLNSFPFNAALYYNKQARQTAIDKILKAVLKHRPGSSTHDIIKKIQVLRTQYGQEVTKIKKSRKYGDEYVYAPKIWWFPELNFLKDYMKSRPTSAKLKDEAVSDEEESVVQPEFVATPTTSSGSKRIRLSEENITIVDRTGTPLTDTTHNSSKNTSNKYVIYENDSFENDQEHQSEIIVEPYTKPTEVKRHEEIGKFVAAQMATIKDDILFYQTQHEILTVINKANLKQLEKNISGGRGTISFSLDTE